MAYGNLTAPAAGSALPVDTIAGTNFPRTKVSFGSEGVAVDVSSANPMPVAPAASELYLGKTGGDVLRVEQVPTTAAGTYATGDVIGTEMAFAGLTRVVGGCGVLQSLQLYSKVAITGAVDVLIFASDPATTFTDNTPLVLTAADFDKLVGVVSLTSWVSLGGPSFAQAHGIGMAFDLSGGTSLWALLAARSAPTLLSATDLKLVLNVIPG
jgi:hypothetical protein